MEKQSDSFEMQIEEAKILLDRLIDPEITLSESVTIYKNGMDRLNKAQKFLDDAKLNFEELNKGDLKG